MSDMQAQGAAPAAEIADAMDDPRRRPSLAVLFGQPDHLSTSFQTRRLARALEPWCRPLPLRVPSPRRWRWLRAPARLWSNYLRPFLHQPGADWLLYANDGCADLRRWRTPALLYWYDAPADWSQTPPTRWIDRLRAGNVRQARHVFAVSAAQVGVARRLRPGREDSVHYLPVGVDCRVFDPATADPGRVRRQFALPAKTIIGYLGYLAGHGERFAGEPLADLAPALLRHLDAHFLVVGFGPAQARFERRVADLGVRGHFTFTGYVPDELLPHALAAMDICVDTLEPGFHSEARSETKLKQYMALGRACVATDLGENRVDLDAGRAGLLVAPDAPAALLDGIVHLCRHPDERTRLGHAARARAEAIYDWSKLAARFARAAGWAPADAGQRA